MRRRFCPICNQVWEDNNAPDEQITAPCSTHGYGSKYKDTDCSKLWPVRIGLSGWLNRLLGRKDAS